LEVRIKCKWSCSYPWAILWIY